MSKCRQCNVEILDHTQICPLCKCVIEREEGAENAYPDIRFRARKLNLALRVFLFLSILMEALLIYVNLTFFQGIWWSVISGAGFAYVYFAVRIAALSKSAGYRSKILSLTFFGVAYVILIDAVIGYHGWSVNYVLPCGLMFVDVAVFALLFINRRNWQSYIMWEMFMVIFSASLFLLMLMGIVTKPFVSVISFVLSAILFLGTLIIGDKRARNELKRRFHVRR